MRFVDTPRFSQPKRAVTVAGDFGFQPSPVHPGARGEIHW
jgi:hypothetical protein